MTVKELTREQITMLKEAYIVNDINGSKNRVTNYSELAFADELVTDEEVYAAFGNMDFTEDDFIA